jgi:cellulose synthase/poly-beta-1,6-N-acetylglucosamine synthase-like glycosyltransferase
MITITEITAFLHRAVFLYFLFSGLYLLTFALSAFLPSKKRKGRIAKSKKNMAVLLPAYKEDNVILTAAREAEKHVSEFAELHVLVIADGLQEYTLQALKEQGTNVMEVHFQNSTKTKAINAALSRLDEQTDYVLILDADNILAEGAVDELLQVAGENNRVVQGHRTAKNKDTGFAILDAISEEVNNHIFRKGHRMLGLSAALIGSGFIAEFNLFKKLMGSIDAVGGFDKELELLLFKNRIKIAYAEDAIIYDEKVQHAGGFYHQRRRWASAQVIYLIRNWHHSFLQLLKYANFDYFDKVLQFALPPRILSAGIPVFIFLFNLLLLQFGLATPSYLIYWGGVIFITSMAVVLAVPLKMWNTEIWKGLKTLPAGFYFMSKAFLTIRGANRKFIHTPHGNNK